MPVHFLPRYTGKATRTQVSEFLFFWGGSEANLKMVPIYAVPISREATVYDSEGFHADTLARSAEATRSELSSRHPSWAEFHLGADHFLGLKFALKVV